MSGNQKSTNEDLFSPLINTNPVGQKDNTLSHFKSYCEKMSLILQSLKNNSNEIQKLFTLLSQKLFDFRENLEQITIQEERLNWKIPEYNIDYTPFYKSFEIALNTWRSLIRTNFDFSERSV